MRRTELRTPRNYIEHFVQLLRPINAARCHKRHTGRRAIKIGSHKSYSVYRFMIQFGRTKIPNPHGDWLTRRLCCHNLNCMCRCNTLNHILSPGTVHFRQHATCHSYCHQFERERPGMLQHNCSRNICGIAHVIPAQNPC